MRTDARVHYTVLTHHTNHNQQTSKNQPISSMVVNEQHYSAARDTQQRANAPNNYFPITYAYSTKCSHDVRNKKTIKHAATHINNQRLCEQKSQHSANHPQLWNDQHQ